MPIPAGGRLIQTLGLMVRALVLAILFLTAACASQSASLRPSQDDLVGTYFFGDGIGPGETLELYADGTFRSSISGDLTVNPIGMVGTWEVNTDRVIFHEAGVASGKKPFHTFALVQTYDGRIVLIPGESAEKDKVYLDFVYRKQPWH